MTDTEALAETLAPEVYEAYRLGKGGRQEYLPDWFDPASREHVPGVEIMRAADAVLASDWLAAHDAQVRAEALAPIEAQVAVTRCEDIHSATEDPPCASCTSFARFAVARRDVRLPAPEPTP